MVDPSYQELDASGIPTAYPEGPSGPVRIKVISGKSFGVESPVRPLGGCWYFHIIFDKKSKIFHDLPAGWTSFAYILKGDVKVGNDEEKHKEFHTLVFSAESDQNGVSLEALEDGTELVLVCFRPYLIIPMIVTIDLLNQISGEPLDQTVYQYGPFVMTTRDEIEKTIMDYRMGKNGFENAHTWKSEIGNL